MTAAPLLQRCYCRSICPKLGCVQCRIVFWGGNDVLSREPKGRAPPSALLTGCSADCCGCWSRHGLGHRDQLAGDLRLGLGAKLEAAATEKRGKNYAAPEDHKMLPKGALYLL